MRLVSKYLIVICFGLSCSLNAMENRYFGYQGGHQYSQDCCDILKVDPSRIPFYDEIGERCEEKIRSVQVMSWDCLLQEKINTLEIQATRLEKEKRVCECELLEIEGWQADYTDVASKVLWREEIFASEELEDKKRELELIKGKIDELKNLNVGKKEERFVARYRRVLLGQLKTIRRNSIKK